MSALWVALLVAGALLGYAAASQTDVGRRFELATVDARFDARGQSRDTPDDVAIVAVSDRTDRALGMSYPYPASVWRDAVRVLDEAGVRAIVLDVDTARAPGTDADHAALRAALREHRPVVALDTEAQFTRDADGRVRQWEAVPGPSVAPLAAAGVADSRIAELPDTVMVDFRTRADAFAQVDLADVLAGRDLGSLRDRTIFVGATSLRLRDTYETPHDDALPGVILHAQAFDNLHSGHWLRVAPWWVGPFAAMLLVGLWIAGLTSPRLLVGLGVAVAATVGYGVLVHTLFVERQLLLPYAAPLLAAVSAGFTLLAHAAWGARRDRRRIASMFSRYVPPDIVVDLMGRDDIVDVVAGRRREVTVLFADIRGFAAMSEHADPDTLVSELNDYLSAMTDAIHTCGGTIDKFLGDGIMALFGAPTDQPDHADRACDAALAMIEALVPVNARRTAQRRPPYRIGIGLCTGTAIVGNVGSHQRLDYTAIGDCVNLAARLEGTTARYGVTIIASASTAEAATRVPLRPMGHHQVRGRIEPTAIFTFGPPAAAEFDEIPREDAA